MHLDEYLVSRSLQLTEVVAAIASSTGLQAVDVLFVAGSLVEGLGNSKSDIDFFLLSDRGDIEFTSLNTVALMVGGCLIDVRVVRYGELSGLLARFKSWSEMPRHPRRAMSFSYDERKMLHRLASGLPLHGAERFAALKAELDVEQFARHKLDLSRFLASTWQIDLAGLRDCVDILSMPFAAQELLGHTVDALLAGHGKLNPNPKWRPRELKGLPLNWTSALPVIPGKASADRLFVELHRAPAGQGLADAVAHASRIVAFSRIVFPSIEYKFLGPANVPLPRLPSVSASCGDRLPCLDLDVQISYQNSRFEIWRLNEQRHIFQITPLAYSLLCLCDGDTSTEEAAERLAQIVGRNEAWKVIDDVCGMIDFAGFRAPPIFTEDMSLRPTTENL